MIGQFKDINNKLYQVEINKYPESVMTLADEPFKIEMSSESLFTNIKGRTATCRIYTNKKLEQLYNSKADDVSIKLTDMDNNIVVFQGFITPNIYNQEWLSDNDIIEIEAVDGISALQYYDYKPINTNTVTSFNQILCNVLNKCNMYNTMYVSASVNFKNSFFLDNLYIDEDNFKDDDDEKKAWKCQEVVEEILKYFNLSIVVYNNDIYLIDYEYIANGFDTFYKVNIADGSYTTVQLSNTYTINKDSHRDTDTNLSLDDTYNQISVSCNTYKYEDYFRDFFYSISRQSKETFTYHDKIYDYIYYSSNSWKQWFYGMDGMIITPLVYGNDTLKNHFGSILTKRQVYDVGKLPARPNYEKLLILRNSREERVEYAEIAFEGNNKQIWGDVDGRTTYLVLSAQICMAAVEQLVMNDTPWTTINKNFAINPNGWSGAWKMSIQIGNKYWNHKTKQWQNQFIVTTIPLGEDGNELFDSWLNFHNNVSYDMNIDSEEGYAIPIRNSDNLYGKLSITIYSPQCPVYNKEHFGDVYYSKYTGVKNFKAKYCKPDPNRNNPDKDETTKENDDIIYKNIIDEQYVNEFDDIELKINTQTELDNSLSSVLFMNGTTPNFLDKLTNVANNTYQIQEENIIQSYYNHYVTPKNILQLSIDNKLTPYSRVFENNLQSTFVVNSISLDIYYNRIITNLIQY